MLFIYILCILIIDHLHIIVQQVCTFCHIVHVFCFHFTQICLVHFPSCVACIYFRNSHTNQLLSASSDWDSENKPVDCTGIQSLGIQSFDDRHLWSSMTHDLEAPTGANHTPDVYRVVSSGTYLADNLGLFVSVAKTSNEGWDSHGRCEGLSHRVLRATHCLDVFSIALEHLPSQKESSLPTIILQVLYMLSFGCVCVCVQ